MDAESKRVRAAIFVIRLCACICHYSGKTLEPFVHNSVWVMVDRLYLSALAQANQGKGDARISIEDRDKAIWPCDCLYLSTDVLARSLPHMPPSSSVRTTKELEPLATLRARMLRMLNVRALCGTVRSEFIVGSARGTRRARARATRNVAGPGRLGLNGESGVSGTARRNASERSTVVYRFRGTWTVGGMVTPERLTNTPTGTWI